MTIGQVRGESASRAGTALLTLLAAQLHVDILEALRPGALPLPELRRGAGSPAPTTLRCHLRELEHLGAVRRTRRDDFPHRLDVELTEAGHELAAVGDVASTWLAAGPNGPLALGSPAAKSSLRALAAAWASGMLRAIAACPLSLTELDSLIADVSYPSLERRLSAMRSVGHLEPARSTNGNRVPQRPTAWLRMAMPTLAAAIRWECTFRIGGPPSVSRSDVEALFLLAVPLVRLPSGLTGVCHLMVAASPGEGTQVEMTATILGDAGATCVCGLDGRPDAWAAGSLDRWFAAVLDGEPGGLHFGGRLELGESLVERLHAPNLNRRRGSAGQTGTRRR